jgi:hypothetical protein
MEYWKKIIQMKKKGTKNIMKQIEKSKLTNFHPIIPKIKLSSLKVQIKGKER